MNVLIADDEILALRSLQKALSRVLPNAAVLTAAGGAEALSLAERTSIDVAFLDIKLQDMSGLELARKLKARQSRIDIILVTAYAEYAMDAWRLYVSGYLLKPADTEDVRTALQHLRSPALSSPKEEPPRLRVQCFGNFEVFYRNEKLHFRRSKAKELFAYLVSRRGASVTSGEICSILWEDDEDLGGKKSMIRTYFASLRQTFRACGLEAAVQHSRDAYSVNMDLLDCDYYRFLSMDPVALNSYQSEFMHQYSWAEPLVYGIEKRLRVD